MAADSGNSATLANASADFLASIVSITPGNSVREALDVSHLGTTTDREYIAGDMWDHGEWTFTYLQDITDAEKTIPNLGTETWTITMPEQTAGNAAPTLAGTAFVVDYALAPLENDTVQIGTMALKFDGFTGPTFTADT